METSFETLIVDLIKKEIEGEYWDFKEVPHDNNADLLHDIICLANSLNKSDKYLIIGVSDPSTGCKLKGLKKGQANRKSQASLVDFIRSKEFAGDIRPEVVVKTIKVKRKEIDVIIISDRPQKPYYLSSGYREGKRYVGAGNIYTRAGDTNTPIDSTADIFYVEKMWRQRFGLDVTPFERMKVLLACPNEWTKDIGNENQCFHNIYPEYTVQIGEYSKGCEVYSFFYPNEASFFGKAEFKYHQTKIFELGFAYCDEMRLMIAVPETQYILLDHIQNWYFYYIKGSLGETFLKFLGDGNYALTSRGGSAPFIIFESEVEKEKFNDYMQENPSVLAKIIPGYLAQMAQRGMEDKEANSIISPLFLDKVKQLHVQWLLANETTSPA